MQVEVRTGGGLPAPASYALSALSVAAATWLELLIVDSPAAMLTLAPLGASVALSVWLGGFRTGLVALVLSAASLDYFIIEPGSFRFSSSHAALVWSTYCALWLAFCFIAGRAIRSGDADRIALRAAQAAAAQSDRVAQLTAALAHARNPAAVMEAAIQEPLHALGGDAGMVLLIGRDGQTAEVARAVGYGGEREARVALALARPSPAWDAVGRGAMVVAPSAAEYAVERAGRPAAAADRDVCALAAIPLLIGSAVVAVVQVEFSRPRLLTNDDRDYLALLAVRGAEALDRTSQYESALRERTEAETLRARAHQELVDREEIERALRASEARYRTLAARTGRLHGLAAALSGAVTVDAVARAVVEHGRNVLGATHGDVCLVVENGAQFETLYSDVRPAESGFRFAADTGLCATEAVAARRPVFIGSFAEWQERYARSAAIAADGGYASSATLPLHVDAAIVGVLAFYFTAPVNFDEEYQALMISVAQHCAQALDRARLYESAQRARADAETANRLKDDFVSIVSHELRTPLNSMLGWTAMLRNGTLDPAATTRALQSVHDNATRQVQLVDELLDLSSLTAGRVKMDVVDVDLRALLRGVVETMVPAAAGNGLTLDLAPVPQLTIHGDARRLEQVFLNVVGNAVKFTPKGGRIAIEVRTREGAAEVRVSDSGPGIDPDFLPHMFDRFRQAHNSNGRRYGGVGLGLSIAKELVEAHHGRIAAESEGPGRGSTFVVTLPAVPAVSLAGTAAQ